MNLPPEEFHNPESEPREHEAAGTRSVELPEGVASLSVYAIARSERNKDLTNLERIAERNSKKKRGQPVCRRTVTFRGDNEGA